MKLYLQLMMAGVQHRVLTALMLIAITIVTAFGLPSLRIDTGMDSLIPASDPARLVYQRIAEQFGTDNKTIIYIRDDHLWAPDKLAELERLHRGIEKLEFVTRVDGLYTLHTIRGSDGKVDSRPLLSSAPTDEMTAEQARIDTLANPLFIDNFISDDGKVTALIVSVKDRPEDNNFNREVNDKLDRLIEPSREVFDKITQVGSPRINAELKSSLYYDFVLLGPLSALILVGAILIFLRSGFAAAVPLLTSGLSIVWTFGLMGWLDIPLNILSAMLPSLIIVIGSTEDTHMMASYFHHMNRHDKQARTEAIRHMARRMGLPLILTVLTTALGFASNIFSSIGLIQHFAIASTFAIIANGLITITLVPMMLSMFGPLENRVVQDDGKARGIPGMIVHAFHYSQDKFPRAILLTTIGLCVFFVYQASKLYVTNDPLSYFPKTRPLIQDTMRIHDDLSGVKLFFITLETDQETAFLEPDNIGKLAQIQDFMKTQGAFDRSISLADHLAFVNREFRQGKGAGMRLPETRQLTAQYLMFFHRSDLDSYVSHDFSSANIVVRHNISDSYTLNHHVEELKDVVRNIAGSDIRTHIVGENLMINTAAESLMIAQIKSLGILLLVIFLIMSAMFTSFKGGIIALVPAVIPIALMFGIMGLLEIPLNPGTAMVAVIAIGIAIDGTIHLLARYNELCRRTSNYAEAVATTVNEEATPLITSSLALAMGFGILLLSNFTVIAQFGALAAATMLFSIFANLLITPIIMANVRLVGLYQILGISLNREVLEKSPLFRNMSNYQRRKAVLISELHEFREGDLLVEQDTIGRSMYLILSGNAEVTRRDGGKAVQLAMLEPGDIFGEIGYIRETERTADVRAVTPVSALRFDYEKLQNDLKFFPNIVAKLNFNISYILGERLADTVESISYNSGEKG